MCPWPPAGNMTCSVATIPHLLLVVVAVVVVLETTKLQVLPDCAGLVAVWYAQDMLALLTMQRKEAISARRAQGVG
jgi:hypothetical protein